MVSLDKMMWNVRGCCCCFNLRTGTLILLWLNLVGAVLKVFELAAGPTNYQSTGNPYAAQYAVKPSPYTTFYIFQVTVLGGIMAAFGLYGVFNRRPSFLKPYIYLNIIQIALIWILGVLIGILTLFGAVVLNSAIGESHDMSSDDKGAAYVVANSIVLLILFGAVFMLLSTAVGWYFTSVIYRYYKQFKAEVFPYQGSGFNAPPGYEAQMKA